MPPVIGDCGRCSPPLSLNRVRAVGLYRPPFNKLVHAFKYSHKTRVGELLGLALAGLVRQDMVLSACDQVCPIPLHPARMRERGFNQSLLLAAAVSIGAGIPLEQALVRHRNTASQTGKPNADKRWKNLKDAFALARNVDVAGRRVLLVDDVFTAGATLDSASRVLLQAGAASVSGAVVAAAHGRGQPQRRSANHAGARSRPCTPV